MGESDGPNAGAGAGRESEPADGNERDDGTAETGDGSASGPAVAPAVGGGEPTGSADGGGEPGDPPSDDPASDRGDHSGPDGGPAVLGIVGSTVALVGTAPPVRAGVDDPAVMAALALAAVALGIFLTRRWDVLPRVAGAGIGGLASLGVVLAATYGLNQDVLYALSIPGLGETPALLLAVVGASVGLAGAVADFGGLTTDGIYRRTVAALSMSAVGVAGFLAIQLWLVVLLAIAIPATTGFAWGDLAATTVTAVGQVGTVLGVGCVAIGYLVLTDRGWDFVDLEWPDRWDVAYVVGGFVVLFGAAIALNAFLTATGTESQGHTTFTQAQSNPEILLLLVPASILVIGPFEELLYRNVIQKSLYDHFSRAGAVVVASIPFALVHFPAYYGGHVGQSLVSLGIILALSLILGALYAKTENLLVPAFVHGLYNAVIFYSAYVTMTG